MRMFPFLILALTVYASSANSAALVSNALSVCGGREENTGTESAESICSFPQGTDTFETSQSTAQSQFGHLGVVASSSAESGPSVNFIANTFADVDAYFHDSYLVSNADSGAFLALRLRLTGNLSVETTNPNNTGGVGGNSAISLNVGGGSMANPSFARVFSESATANFSTPADSRSIDEDIEVLLSYNSATSLGFVNVMLDGGTRCNAATNQTCLSELDFLLAGALQVVGGEILDASMNPIDGAIVIADSGFNYLNPTVVPAPSAILLFVTALAGLLSVGNTKERC